MFIQAVVASVNTSSVNASHVSIISVENSNSDTVVVKTQISFAAGSITSSGTFCSSYLTSLTAAVSSDFFDEYLHQHANSSSVLSTAYCETVGMEECSNASPSSLTYIKGPKQFTLSIVGVIVGVIIVIFGCCCLVASTYGGYRYWRAKVYPYEGMDLDELAAKLEMSEKKEDEGDAES